MSGIVLSASVRQNLLSLQSTASLLATTQNDLATGNAVNSALDNPTSYFTAESLNNRASDINNLLDGIGNGVQVLQAANTGITSLQSLISNAQSIANQVLQTSVGYSTKSTVTSAAITGATADNLDGTVAPYSDATITGSAAVSNSVAPPSSTDATPGSEIYDGAGIPATGSTVLSAITDVSGSPTGLLASDNVVINGVTLAFVAGNSALSGSGSSYTLGIGNTLQDLFNALNGFQGGGADSRIVNGQIILNSGTTNDLNFFSSSSVYVLPKLGLTGGRTATPGGGGATTPALSGTTLLNGTPSQSNSVLTSQFQSGNTITVDGQTLTFVPSGASGANQINIGDDVTTLLGKIDALSGGSGSSVSGGEVTLHTGTTSDLTITSSNQNALAALGIGTSVSQNRNGGASLLDGTTLTIGPTGNGTATSITFGDGTNGTVKTLNQLNAALASNNLQASIDSSGVITITTTNDAASSTVGGTIGIGGTATVSGKAFYDTPAAAAVADANSQATRNSLVAQYNQVLQQINTTSADSSFNGINLLNGDTLNLTFDETGASKLAISGVTFDDAGLGLSTLTAGKDFLDSNSANSVLSTLTQASTTLRTEASSLGSNLSVVEIRQDFNKSLINVLQTGASNLTLADPNQEAANSQALSTRQSIAVSALALANQSQQSVLQLLR